MDFSQGNLKTLVLKHCRWKKEKKGILAVHFFVIKKTGEALLCTENAKNRQLVELGNPVRKLMVI